MKSDLVIAGLFAAKHRMSADRVDTRPLGRNALRKLVAASFERIRRLGLRGENPVIWFRRPGLIAGVKSLTDERQTPARYHITVEYAPFRVRAQDLPQGGRQREDHPDAVRDEGLRGGCGL